MKVPRPGYNPGGPTLRRCGADLREPILTHVVRGREAMSMDLFSWRWNTNRDYGPPIDVWQTRDVIDGPRSIDVYSAGYLDREPGSEHESEWDDVEEGDDYDWLIHC
jgi:hypothetical protein